MTAKKTKGTARDEYAKELVEEHTQMLHYKEEAEHCREMNERIRIVFIVFLALAAIVGAIVGALFA